MNILEQTVYRLQLFESGDSINILFNIINNSLTIVKYYPQAVAAHGCKFFYTVDHVNLRCEITFRTIEIDDQTCWFIDYH